LRPKGLAAPAARPPGRGCRHNQQLADPACRSGLLTEGPHPFTRSPRCLVFKDQPRPKSRSLRLLGRLQPPATKCPVMAQAISDVTTSTASWQEAVFAAGPDPPVRAPARVNIARGPR